MTFDKQSNARRIVVVTTTINWPRRKTRGRCSCGWRLWTRPHWRPAAGVAVWRDWRWPADSPATSRRRWWLSVGRRRRRRYRCSPRPAPAARSRPPTGDWAATTPPGRRPTDPRSGQAVTNDCDKNIDYTCYVYSIFQYNMACLIVYNLKKLESVFIITLCAKISGAVYCNRSCLRVCGCVCVCVFVDLLPR